MNSWMKFRQNIAALIDFARVVFAFLYESNEIELFLRDSLKLDMNSENAEKYIKNKIQNAPKQWKTKLKNVVHGFAQKMKSSGNNNNNNNNNNISSSLPINMNGSQRDNPILYGIGNCGLGNVNGGRQGNKVIL